LELSVVNETERTWGGRRTGAGRKPANPLARPNVPHRARPVHKGRFPVHVTMRARRGLPSFRNQVVRNLMRAVLKKQASRHYASAFQVVHFSIQDDHLHLIVEALLSNSTETEKEDVSRSERSEKEREALRRGISGLAISFARRLNRVLRRKGKVWGDRHHRRDLESPTDVRNTLRYVLQNWLRHGMKTFGAGVVDPYSTALRFDGWADAYATIIETEPWPEPRCRTWLLRIGWTRAGGMLRTFDAPPAAKGVRYAPIVTSYVPDTSMEP
jgi:putative transposase